MTPGERAVQRAEKEWQAGVVEAPGPAGFGRIDHYIRSTDGVGWKWWRGPAGRGYDRNGCFAWCGAFAAYAWAEDVPLPARREHFASTYRLWEWGRHGGAVAFQEAKPGGLLWTPEPGDLAIIERGDGGPAWADHITVIRAYDPATDAFATVEGNAVGIDAQGHVVEGVVHKVRYLKGHAPLGRKDFVRFLIRPMPAPELVT